MYNKSINKLSGKISISVIGLTIGIATFIFYGFLAYEIINLNNKNPFDKGKTLLKQDNYYGAIDCFNQAEKNNKKNSLLYLNLGEAYFKIKKYEDALTNFNKSLAISSTNPNAIAWKAYYYVMLEDYEKADTLCTQALKLNPNNALAYNVKGEILYSIYNDKDAITNFDKSIKLDQNYSTAYINKIKTLYDENEFVDCIAFSKETLKKFPKLTDIYKYTSDSLSKMDQHQDAINELKVALKISPKDPVLLSNLGWEYLYIKNSVEASNYAKKALALNPDLEDALNLEESISKDKLSEAVKITNFIRANYLYFDKMIDFDKKAKAFEANENPTSDDISKFIEDIKLKEDNFTFTLTGKDFDDFIKEENSNQLTSKSLNEKTFYIKINSFNSTVYTEFENALQKIEKPEEKNLVIDLRDDTGGVITASNHILDLLLPKCTTSFTINRTGTIHPYYSDENQTKFKKIIILVNDYTASSSELLTLGLKKYLNNVVVIGHTTFGKGVGQSTYNNDDKKYCIFLVSLYWNVKETNIADIGITPDIILKGSTESDYMNEVNNQ